ncbi:hypothetical protein [Halomonas denitrificans]|uniref:hypothetical protein n=1 Tax=Halomonas denitrificans TaxID=370769 RepID=UPI000D3D9054|nr:hypothetical protein [Halomonas denitrificans]
MQTLLLLLALLALVVPMAAAGVPAGGVSAQALGQLLREQSAWLAEQSDDPAPELPGVGFERQPALQQRCFPDFREPLGVRIKGAYDPREARIYLDAALDLATRLDQSYLLHELVHHFQVHRVRFREAEPHDEASEEARSDGARPGVPPAGAEARSRGRLEGEAYRLQLRWLEHVGVADPLEALGLDDRTLQIIERSLR